MVLGILTVLFVATLLGVGYSCWKLMSYQDKIFVLKIVAKIVLFVLLAIFIAGGFVLLF